jgi:ATPase subunit of ABC transporter with duplicated ATPase domains
MSILNFVTNGTLAPSPSQRRHDMARIRREAFARKLEHLNDDCIQARELIRDLMRSGEDTSQEIAKLATGAKALLLLAKLLEREAK